MQNDPTPYGYCECGCGEKTTVAVGTAASKGWVKGQPLRFLLGHNRRGKYTVAMQDIMDRLDRESSPVGCWLWTGPLSGGYGTANFEGRPKRVHQLTFEYSHGPVANGLHLHHLCEVRHCANPDHLVALTVSGHAAQHPSTWGKPRNPPQPKPPKTHCKWGHLFDAENTYIPPGGGRRFCRACNRNAKARQIAKAQP